MRVLTFKPDTEDQFTLLYSALYGSEKKLTIGEFRTHVKILDKCEAISTEGETPQHPRKLVFPEIGDCQLKLEDVEYELMKQLVQETQWTVRVSRLIVGLTDALEAATKE